MTGSLSMIMLDQTVVSVALPSMARELPLTPHGQQWVVNAYVLALAALVALGGKAADLLGQGAGVPDRRHAVLPRLGGLRARVGRDVDHRVPRAAGRGRGADDARLGDDRARRRSRRASAAA